MIGESRPENSAIHHFGRSDNATPAARLEHPQSALAELEQEYFMRARDENDPEVWGIWADLHTALMAIRAAQGRAHRIRDGYRQAENRDPS